MDLGIDITSQNTKADRVQRFRVWWHYNNRCHKSISFLPEFDLYELICIQLMSRLHLSPFLF